MPAGGQDFAQSGTYTLSVNSDSKIKIRKRPGQGMPPQKAKIVTISLALCSPSSHYYYEGVCNSLNSAYSIMLLHLNITVPAPKLPDVQCYMSPWSGSIDFQPVTVPVEPAKAGLVNWPLNSSFTGVEQLSSSLTLTCDGISDVVNEFPLDVKLSASGFTPGADGELYFENEKNIAIATKLDMATTSQGRFNLDPGSACDTYLVAGANSYSYSPRKLGEYPE